MPVKGDDGGWVLVYPKPDWCQMFDRAGVGYLFVDELNTAGRNIQSAMLGMIQEKEIGAHHFGPRIRIMGAMNAIEDAGGGHEGSAGGASSEEVGRSRGVVSRGWSSVRQSS